MALLEIPDVSKDEGRTTQHTLTVLSSSDTLNNSGMKTSAKKSITLKYTQSKEIRNGKARMGIGINSTFHY